MLNLSYKQGNRTAKSWNYAVKKGHELLSASWTGTSRLVMYCFLGTKKLWKVLMCFLTLISKLHSCSRVYGLLFFWKTSRCSLAKLGGAPHAPPGTIAQCCMHHRAPQRSPLCHKLNGLCAASQICDVTQSGFLVTEGLVGLVRLWCPKNNGGGLDP